MGQAKRRREFLQTVLSEPVREEGLFFLYKRDGVSVALVVSRLQGEEVQAGLFCVDEWQEGLFQCLERIYPSSAAFQEDFKRSRLVFKPSTFDSCRQLVARGLDIRRRLTDTLPADFFKCQDLLEKLPELPPVEHLYFCPLCESPLPEETVQTILSSAGENMSCYLLCEECIRLRRPGPSAELAVIKHRHAMEPFEDMETFSLQIDQEPQALLMAMPSQVHRDAIVHGLEQDGDAIKTASFALESWMHRATQPNERITDAHVIEALEHIRRARQNNTPLPGECAPEVGFVRDAAQEGLAVFASACGDRLISAGREAAVAGAIDKVLDSARFHKDISDPRSYIHFVAPFMK